MESQTKLNIYVVEDMALTRLSLIQILNRHGHEVIGSSANVNSAIPQLSNLPIDLVLLDVNLKGTRDGIWLGNYIREHLNLPFIYLTAYGDANTLSRIHSTEPDGYIMKPYNETTLLNTITIAFTKFKKGKSAQIHKPNLDDFLIASKRSTKVKIKFNDIKYITSESNYVKIQTATTEYLERMQLKVLNDLLPDASFIKVNRSLIVNLAFITKIENDTIFISELEFPISRVYKKELVARYQNI